MATTTQTQVQQLYVGLLGRAADQGGLNWWADQVTTGGRTLEDIRASFVTSTEYTTLYGSATTRTDLVTAIYQNLFERTPSAGELQYWVTTDTRPADQLVSAFLQFASTADQTVINNKTFVAQTYTDTVGANFNAAAAAAVIANVDGTTASVNTALNAISNGNLAGQVAGQNLVNALASAQTADAAYETANKAALDALATKLNVTIDPDFDTQLGNVQTAADAARALAANGGSTATEVLAAQVSVDQKAVDTAFNALNAAGKTAATAYQNALTANEALKAASATDVAAVQAGLTTADTGGTARAAAESATSETFADSKAVYDFYVDAATTAAQRTAIEKAYSDAGVTYFATNVKTVAATDVAKNAAAQAVVDTKAAVTTADATNGGTYNSASDTLVASSTTLKNAQAADVDKAASDALVASNAASEKVVTDAAQAITDYNSANTASQLKSITGATVTASDAVKETFYFATSPVDTAGADTTVGTATAHFGAGDAIVLGSGYTYNSGALTTGDNNKLEFFFVNTNTGVQVVVETKAFASASLTADANTGVAASATDNATVITLTGVTADHLAVNNGVISYV